MKRLFLRLSFAAALACGASAFASTFSVAGSGNKFIVTRDDASAAETVRYRTVVLSAYPGQHLTEKSGTLTFAAGQTAVTNTVTVTTPSADAYKFQTGTSRSYRFEITDVGGFPITNAVRSFATGTSVPSSGAFDVKDVTIQSAEYTADDRGYDKNGYKSVASSGYFNNAAPREYYDLIGAQLRMTLSMQAKENDDAYEYLQLLFDNTATCDNRSGANNGDPGTPGLSSYMAGFEMDTGSTDGTYRNYTFPVTTVDNNAGATNPWGHSSDGKYPLSNQKFNTATSSRATDGRIVVPLDFSSIVLRLNASGKSGSDEWAAKSVVAHIQAVDSSHPYKLAFSVAPGFRARGNDLYVSVAFSEPVTCSFATLSTTWGKLSYNSGNGSNVLTFKGKISDAASGSLGITNRSGTVTDLAGNSLSGSLNQTSLATLDASHAYAISCDLAGGSASNPTTYTYDSAAITLANPTRTGYTFDGWSGTGISGLTDAVTIPARSHGDRAYAAHWTPVDYTVRFAAPDANSGSMPDQTFTYDVATNLAANAFTRTGYTFDGWDYAGATYPDGAAVQNLTNESATVTLSARWTPVTYTVRFDPDAGTGVMPDQTFTYDVATNLAANAFARAHYAFAGWSGAGPLLPDGATVTNLAAAQGATVTLTATWTPAPTWTGTGTAESPYLIYNRDQLDDLAAYVNANDGSYRDSVYRLMADIAYDPAATNSFTPIGRTSSRFQGVFDGNGHTIGGISISRPDTNYQGLFGYLDIATVMNLTLADSSIEGYSYVGGLFGYAKNAAIRNCFVTGTSVAGNSDSGAVGGNAADCNLIKNAYHGCTRNGSADNRGIGNLGDTLDRVWPCGTLSFESGVEPFDGPDYAFPVYGTTNSYYAVGWPVDVRTAVAGATVFVNGSTNGVSGDNGEFSFYMPNGDATVSSAVAYLDTNGDLQYCASYTVVTNAAADVEYGRSNGTSWYVVDGDVAIDGTLRFLDTYAHLILCDGATLAVTNASGSGYAIDAHDLRIYGQAGGTGTIAANGGSRGLSADNVTVNGGSVTADSDTESGRGIYATYFVTINGGTVNATGSYGISAHRSLTITGGSVTADGSLNGIFSFGTVTIGGGTVVATGSRNGIDADDGIILGWTDYADSITASGYSGTVSVKAGQLLTDGTVVYQGEVDPAAIAGKTLRPYFVPYIDANGDGQVCTNYTVLTNAAGDVEYGESGAENWYVVTTDVTIGGQLSFNDDCTHLILCDGATITVTNGNGNAIYPSKNLDSSRVLVLYGQANGTGVLVANGSDYGIRAHGGSVTINGGNVIATGKGPGFFAGGDITINGGSVTATGHTIGIYASSLIINGGSVTAEGTISGGIRAHSGSVTINGGNVSATVTGGTSDGIYADDDLTINGGSVTVTGGNNGIYAGGDVTINGGSVTATGGSDTANANHNGIHAGGTFTINGGIVTATGGHYGIWANDITLGWTNPADSITASGYSGRVHVKDRQRLTDGDNTYRSIIRDPAAIAGKTLRPAMPAISYLDEDGVERQRYLYTVLANADTDVAYGEYGAENWYVVTNAVTVDGNLLFTDDCAHLIVCDGATLTVTNMNGETIVALGNLVLYGQANGTGALVATGSGYGISADGVTINGGAVNATGSSYHGISVGGFSSSVTVNGGSVTATGGDYGIYVGDGSVTVNGGSVTATGGDYGIYALAIVLGWSDPDDSIYASSYNFNGTVSVKAGQFLTDGTTVYRGEVDPDDIAGKTLVPYTTPWKSLQARLNAGGTVTLSEDATAEEDDATLVVTNAVTIDLNGHTIDADGRFCVIQVLEGGDLTLTNSVEESGAIVNGHDRYDGNVYVSGGGVHVDGGAICSNAVNLSTGQGGGVYVTGGTFTMTGGTICSNDAASSGGGVYVTRGTFEMSGGSIANNTASSGGGVFATDGSTFTISGGLIANNHAANGGGGVYVDGNSSRSTFTMTGGEISGNVVSNMSTVNIISGGGVCVYGNGGAFAMTGGTILSNSVQGTVKPYGGGVYVEGGRQATMTGGTISGNFVTSTSTGDDADGASGGGVCVRICSFTMAGGEISGNRSSKNGGGVAMQGTTRHLFTMSGGTISGNEASCIGGNRICGGGGVFMNGGTFAMTNGAISGNVADCTEAIGYGGGGVYVNSGTFEMADSAVSGNAAGNGGGVYMRNGTFKVSGVSVVSGNTNAVGAAANVYLPSGKEIAVDGLSPGAFLGVTTADAPTADTPVAFATGTAAGDGRYFTSDDPAFAIEAANDVLNLVKPPTTPWNLLQAKLDAGGTVTLASGVTATDGDATLVVTNAVTLDLDGCTIDAAGRFGVIRVAAGGDLTLTNGFPESGAVTGGNAYAGGGVYVENGGAFTMNGGAISGNAALWDGGGVYVDIGGTFTVSGRPVVSCNANSVGAANNVYLYLNSTIGVDGLSSGASIGVTTAVTPTFANPVTFATGVADGDDAHFFSDDPGFAVYGDSNSRLFLRPVAYTVRFDANGGTGAMPDQTFAYDTRQALASNAFTRTGYTFAGWRGADGSIYPDGATVSNLVVRHDCHKEDDWKLFDRMPYPGKSNDDYNLGDRALQNRDDNNGANLYTGFENSAWNPEDPDTAALLSQNAFWFDEHDARDGVSMKLIEDFPNFYKEPVDDAQDAVVTLAAIWLPPVPYIDADGNEQTCAIYTVLTNATGNVEYGKYVEENWYLVATNVTINGRLYFYGTARLIVCDGATLTVTNAGGDAIDTYGGDAIATYRNLAIYCQTNGTGAVVANGRSDGYGIYAGGNMTVNGGTVTATGGYFGIHACGSSTSVTINGGSVTVSGGIHGIDARNGGIAINGGSVTATGGGNGNGIHANGTVTINGGSVTATGTGEYAIGVYAGGNIALGWTNPTDSIYASGYDSYAGTVSVKDGQLLTDGYGGIYESTILDTANIAGKTLWPGFKDPEGAAINDHAIIEWLAENGFTQDDIDALGNDAAATDRLYECWLLGLDFRVPDAGAALSLTGIAVGDGVVSLPIQFVRKAPLGAIHGVLHLYAARDLAAGFLRSPIAKEAVDFGTGDPTFDTATATVVVTQTVTAAIDTAVVTNTFFKAVIEVVRPDEPEEP